VRNVVTYTIPMHQGGRFVSLEEVLGAINGAGLEWRLSWLQAVSSRDSSLDVVELEAKTRNQQGGLLLTDVELRTLARQLDQVIDGEFRGFAEGSSHDSGGAALIEVAAFDSTEWTLTFTEAASERLDVDAEVLRVE